MLKLDTIQMEAINAGIGMGGMVGRRGPGRMGAGRNGKKGGRGLPQTPCQRKGNRCNRRAARHCARAEKHCEQQHKHPVCGR